MSLESAGAFIARMRSDKEFAKQIIECQGREALLDFLAGAGFDLTMEEVQNAEGELSDEVLAKVVGGIGMSGSGTFPIQKAPND